MCCVRMELTRLLGKFLCIRGAVASLARMLGDELLISSCSISHDGCYNRALLPARL